MSEYVSLQVEYSDDPAEIEIKINQRLTDMEQEMYASIEEGELGSPIAQMLFQIEGIRAMTIYPDTLIIWRELDTAWEIIVDEVRDALRDFYL
ncbi:hypothetical protein MASR2M15_25890 [Anaerolineales bacterium]